jgi:hypothetical protein
MIRLYRRPAQTTWERQRRRLIQETEQFLEHRLANPEVGVRIPAMEVNRANFQPWMTKWFWGKVLDL